MRKFNFFSNIKESFRWLNLKKEKISSWITIIGLPFLIFGGIVAYFQLGDYVIKADLKFKFTYSDRFYYYLVNDTSRTAEDPYYGFIISDLNVPAPNFLPLPFEVDTFIKPKSSMAPKEAVVGSLDEANHKYYGTAMVTCKNCKSTQRYFLYINNEDPSKGFYMVFKNNDDYSNIINKVNEAKSVDVIPLTRRINFSDKPK